MPVKISTLVFWVVIPWTYRDIPTILEEHIASIIGVEMTEYRESGFLQNVCVYL
jgi:hypothetical protein